MLVAALAFAWALPRSVSAQQSEYLLIEPDAGGAGSRFQIVGRAGWTAGESVALHISFTTAPDPVPVESGPHVFETTVLVLMDGTWSFPVVVDAVFGSPLPDSPGAVVVRATSPTRTAIASYTYGGASAPPASTDGVPAAGFGPAPPASVSLIVVALFAAGIGVLLLVGGAARRTRTT